LNPESGDVLWTFDHGGQNNAISTSGLPVQITEGRYFVKNRGDGGVLFSLERAEGKWQAEEIWRTRDIRGTYIYPVTNGEYLYGYNNRILNCVSLETGERVWRSRAPGDGLPILIDNHLVIITKKGELSIAPATGEGYEEIAGLALFDDIVWSPVSFANGRLYARSMSEIAAVDIITDGSASASDEPEPGVVPGTQFPEWVAKVEASEKKTELLDAFMAKQKSFPVIEGDSIVHFIYRGEAEQVSLTGDLVGRRYDRPMHRISGTDFFYYSSPLEPDSHQVYQYILNLQQTVTDPHNTRQVRTLYFRNASWFAMPKWTPPDYLEARSDGRTGHIDSLDFVSNDEESTIEVYLPHGYGRSEDRYPVVYLHHAKYARRYGLFDVALDNLIEQRIEPVIFVFLPDFLGGGYTEYMGDRKDEHARVFADEVVPLIDKTYRTIPDRDHRANIGSSYGGFMAFRVTHTYSDRFAKVAIQTIAWDQAVRTEYAEKLGSPSSHPPIDIYLDWAKYDMRSPNEGNDSGVSTEAFAAALKAGGYTYAGGETNDGAGFVSSRTRLHRVFEFLFPITP